MTVAELKQKREDLKQEFVNSNAKFEVGQTVSLTEPNRKAIIIKRWLNRSEEEPEIIYRVDDYEIRTYNHGVRVPATSIWGEEELLKQQGLSNEINNEL